MPTNCFSNSLHGMIAHGNTHEAKSKIQSCCELNLADARGYTALHLAVEYRRYVLIIFVNSIKCKNTN